MGNWESNDIKDLKLDQAYLNISSSLEEVVTIFTLSDDCIQCSPKPLATLNGSGEKIKKISTKYPETIFVTNGNATNYYENIALCSIKEPIGEFGKYDLHITDNQSCEFSVRKDPVNPYLSLLPCFFFYVALGLIWVVGNYLYKKYKESKQTKNILEAPEAVRKEGNVNVNAEIRAEPPKKPRLKSIDTFRGICIVIMIFVNNGGGGYYFFEHATWDGLLIADLVFPWFLWIMGVCIPISIASQLKRASPKIIFRRILKRSIYLFIIGIMLGSGNVFKKLRIFGVLQRFSLTYFVVANVQLVLSQWYSKECQSKKLQIIYDIVRLLPHWIFMILLILIHTLLTFLLPVPGCPTGYLGPGGRHLNGSYPDCTGGSCGYIDRVVLGSSHLYQNPTSKYVYDATLPYDPEGILGTLTSCFQVFLGVQAGVISLTYTEHKPKIVRWLLWSFGTGVVGALFTKCSQDDGWIPLNKNLWSLSFVLVTSCFAFALLAFCYVIIDVKNWWQGSPFYYPGMNSILLYCGHNLAYSIFPFTWVVSDMETHFIQMVACLWTTSAWVVVAVWLFHIKFFLAL